MAIQKETCTTGRRKCASASVKLRAGTGKIKVNGVSAEEYFKTDSVMGYILQPLTVTNMVEKFDINARIKGGGLVGQAGALRHGIARALVVEDETLKINQMKLVPVG